MIIGISGAAGVGKDTAADFLVQNYGFVKMSLADEMKRICMRVYDFSYEQLWGPSYERNKPDYRYKRFDPDSGEPSFLTPRMALQLLGTEWARRCYENTWVDLTLRNAKFLLSDEGAEYSQVSGMYSIDSKRDWTIQGVVIPDVRFFNEIAAVKKAGGIVIRLVRDLPDMTAGVAGHASEAELANAPKEAFDYVLDTNGGIDIMENKLSTVYQIVRLAGAVRWLEKS
jgi:hypothetical protein